MIDTRKLSSSAYMLTTPKRGSWLKFGLGLLLVLGAGVSLGWWQAGASGQGVDHRQATLEQENQRLGAALEQAQLQSKHEASTRESLERQLAEQSEEIKRLNSQLEFFQKNRKVPVGVR